MQSWGEAGARLSALGAKGNSDQSLMTAGDNRKPPVFSGARAPASHLWHARCLRLKPRAQRPEPVQCLAIRPQYFSQFAIDPDCFLRRLVEHLCPAARVWWQVRLRNEIGGLHDGFERIAEIVSQGTQFKRDFSRDLVAVSFHLITSPRQAIAGHRLGVHCLPKSSAVDSQLPASR